MPTSGSRDMGSWPAASMPRMVSARVVSSRAVGRFSRLSSVAVKNNGFLQKMLLIN